MSVLQQHLYLIGYRGSGKSTVGPLLAEQLHCPFEDTDARIVEAAGIAIREIFEREGEVGFRDREQECISLVSSESPRVIALGGGAILRTANRECLRKHGQCVWLTGTPQRLYERIQQDSHSQSNRPQLTDQSGYAEVVEMLEARQPLYAELAEKTIDTDQCTPEDIVREIIDWVT